VISIRRFTDKELMILTKLADDKGHALWDLEQRTSISKGNLKPKIDCLIEKRTIYKGAIRKTRNKSTGHPNNVEKPYYIRPQSYFFIREELHSSLIDIQSKLRHRYELGQTSDDNEKNKKLKKKLDLYRNLLSEFDYWFELLKNRPPIDHRLNSEDDQTERVSEKPEDTCFEFLFDTPAGVELSRIIIKIIPYCKTREMALCAALEARPDLYTVHEVWSKGNILMPPKQA
jgi:hypothetical protein